MQKCLSVLLVCGFLIWAGDGQKPDQGKGDLDQMQGNWHAVAMEGKGKAKSADDVKKFQLIVNKDAFTVKLDGADHLSGKLVLRADKKPKQVDLVQETGPLYKGIYEINGQRLKMCVCISSDADSERPKNLATKEDSENACITWERTP
jgi:uncharacterized protein (TIGR03067 family)